MVQLIINESRSIISILREWDEAVRSLTNSTEEIPFRTEDARISFQALLDSSDLSEELKIQCMQAWEEDRLEVVIDHEKSYEGPLSVTVKFGYDGVGYANNSEGS